MLEEFKKILKEKGEVYMRVKVRPNAGRTAVKEVMAGEEGKTVKVDIAAPPEKGKANLELIKFFEQQFQAGKGSAKIISGKAEKIKLIKITVRT